MVRSIKELDCTRIPELQHVLRNWRTVNREMAERWKKNGKEDGEVPWWFNERGAVSVLAGAVWKCGKDHYAFEEFNNEKLHTHSLSERPEGRIDLYVDVKSTKFVAEAKICWAEIDNDKHDAPAIVKKWLDRAMHDVKKDKPSRLKYDKKLAIVFVVPRALIDNVKSSGRTLGWLIEKWAESVKGVGEVRAWTFPRGFRQHRGAQHYYPGIAVFIKQVL